MEKYAFRMQLNPGREAEYRRRHDAIWPELVALLREAGVSDYSIHLDRETGTLFGVLWRRDGHGMDALPGPSGDAALVGAYGRHHGDQPGRLAGRRAARDRLPPGMSGGAARPRHRHRQDQRQGGAGRHRDAAREIDVARAARTRCCPGRPIRTTTWTRIWRFILDGAAALHGRARRRRDRRHHARRDRGAGRCRGARWRCRSSTTSTPGPDELAADYDAGAAGLRRDRHRRGCRPGSISARSSTGSSRASPRRARTRRRS